MWLSESFQVRVNERLRAGPVGKGVIVFEIEQGQGAQAPIGVLRGHENVPLDGSRIQTSVG